MLPTALRIARQEAAEKSVEAMGTEISAHTYEKISVCPRFESEDSIQDLGDDSDIA